MGWRDEIEAVLIKLLDVLFGDLQEKSIVKLDKTSTGWIFLDKNGYHLFDFYVDSGELFGYWWQIDLIKKYIPVEDNDIIFDAIKTWFTKKTEQDVTDLSFD